jgi:CDP-diglyceride synthetase
MTVPLDPLVVPALAIVAGVSAIGLVLAIAIGIVHRAHPETHRERWLKLAILLAIVLLLVLAGAGGPWGLLPVAILLGYWGWRELVDGIQKRYGPIACAQTLPLLGTAGLLSGLEGSFTSMALAALLAAWTGLVLPILLTRKPPPLQGLLVTGFGIFWISLPCACLLALVNRSYGAYLLLVFLVMANDGFSEGFGRLLGKTPLFLHISPSKTIGGALGGFLTCFILGGGMRFMVPGWQLGEILLLSAGTAALALLGDAIASAIKREVGIKNFGRLLAITGGILDKFDSLFFAAPIFYAIAVYLDR